jgi:HNH endonuclease
MFLKEFGMLSEARRAAGTQTAYRKAKTRTTYWQKYTKGELIAQLKELGRKLGRKPTDRDINAESKLGRCASSTTFARMFGSLPDAYRAAGFEAIKPRSYTDKEIAMALKRISKNSAACLPSMRFDARASGENVRVREPSFGGSGS